MESVGDAGRFSDETESVRWATEREARDLIAKSTTVKGRARDLRVLAKAFEEWGRIGADENGVLRFTKQTRTRQ